MGRLDIGFSPVKTTELFVFHKINMGLVGVKEFK